MLVLSLFLPACARAADPEAEIEKIIGKPLAESFKAEYGVVKDPTLQAWVNRVGGQVAAQSPRQDVHYTFVIADTDIINAFSLPGGTIFVTRGLLDDVQSDDELAAILGHEVGHETHYDAAKLISASLAVDLLNTQAIKPRTDLQSTLLGVVEALAGLSLSRHNESMADEAGVDFSERAGYDPNAFETFFAEEGGKGGGVAELLETHPPDKDRIRRTRARIAAKVKPADWQRIGDNLAARGEYYQASQAYTASGDQADSAKTLALAKSLPVPVSEPTTAPYQAADQQRFMSKIEHARSGLRQANRTDRVASTLQQILLFEFPTQDAASILVAAQAYAAVEQAEDVFSSAAFVTRTSPAAWGSLSGSDSAPVGSLAAVNSAQAAGDLASASETVQGVTGPLDTAEGVLTAALLDLDSPAIRVRDHGTRWAQYGALEAAAITATASLNQAGKSAAKARESVASADLRILEEQLDAYPLNDDYTAIAARQLNVSPDTLAQVVSSTSAGGQGGYGTAAVLIGLGAEAKQDPLALASERAQNQNESAVDMAHTRGASLTSLVTILRMIHLDFEHAGAGALTPSPSPNNGRGVTGTNPAPASPAPTSPPSASGPTHGGVDPPSASTPALPEK